MKKERLIPIYSAPDGEPVSGHESPELLGTLALIDEFSKRLMDPKTSFEEVITIHDQTEESGVRVDELRATEKSIATGYTDAPRQTIPEEVKTKIAAKLMDKRTSLEELETLRAQVYGDSETGM